MTKFDPKSAMSEFAEVYALADKFTQDLEGRSGFTCAASLSIVTLRLVAAVEKEYGSSMAREILAVIQDMNAKVGKYLDSGELSEALAKGASEWDH